MGTGDRSVVARDQKWEEKIHDKAGGNFSENTPHLHDGSNYLTVWLYQEYTDLHSEDAELHGTVSYTSVILIFKDFFIFICVCVCAPT